MPRMIFVNLPVQDAASSTRFYESIGCSKNEQFSNENSAAMVWSDTIVLQLLNREYFASLTTKPTGDVAAKCAAVIALSQETREAVDFMTQRAASGGGRADMRAPLDMGFMYVRTFEDPDGHTFEAVWLAK
jgi:uncharacterized protein